MYVVVKENTDMDQMFIDIHIPYPWCHLILRIEVVSSSFVVFGVNSLTPNGRERPNDTVSGMRRFPVGTTFIAMCNEHTLFVRPI